MKRFNKKILISFIIAIVAFVSITVVVSAAILMTFTRGNIQVTTSNVAIETSYTAKEGTDNWIYTKAGDSKDFEINITNNTQTNIHRYYKVELNTQLTNQLASAILVYYNNEFVDTLINLNNNLDDKDIDNQYALIPAGGTAKDTISFKLHQAASNEIFNGKTISIKMTTYSENADYINYSVVNSEADFEKIMNDLNSGLLDTVPTLVLAKSITLSKSYTITFPTVIQTNGYNITGVLNLNDNETTNPDALVTILGGGTVGVTLGTYYDKEAARELVANYAKEVLKYGIKAGSTPEVKNIIGPYAFYGITVAVEAGANATFTTPNLTASQVVLYTQTEHISFTGNNKTTTIAYKHIGKNSDIDEENVLVHMPTANKIVTNDIFLPTFLPEYNATITWNSSDTSIMTNDGRIVQETNDRVPVTLTARIKVNDTVYTRSYTFYITSNNNQVNFQKLVKDISPLIIKKKFDATKASETTYCLPIVTSTGTGLYDYRTTYESPTVEPTFFWTAHENIHLVSLEYAKYYDGTEDNPIDTYDYITVDDNEITLTKDTLSNYAKIRIIGTFDNGEVHEGIVNISIALGSDTELLEKAFNNVYDALEHVSVLGNIIQTRKDSNIGMTGEKGDFTLPASFGESYTISYEVADSSGIISVESTPVEINGELVYQFTVDPTKFNSVETSIPVSATVTYTKTDGSTLVKTKIIYVQTPAAIHISDVGNVSIFNTLKYQVVDALLAGEKNNTGFSVSANLCTNSVYDYILLRDIVGDATYLTNYTNNSIYLEMNNYSADGSDGVPGVSSIKLYNLSENDSNITDTLAYDFIRLINWATGDTKALASSVLSAAGQAKLSATQNAYKSNAEVYLTENELEVIETFYLACTNNNTTVWNQIKAQALETAPGMIYDNADLLVTILKCLTDEKGTNSGWYENNGNGTYGKIYAKYLEIINRYGITTSENEEPMSPAQEVYNSKFYYSFTATAQNATTGTTAVSFPCKYYDASGNLVSGYCNRYGENNWRGYSSGHYQGTYAAENKTGNAAVDLYANATGHPYDSDHTKYLTKAELMVFKAFWLGALGSKTENAANNVLHQFNANSIALITSALAADENGILPYPNYSISDFTYYGQAILNAFDACLVVPTYFTSNGIGLLINSFYENYNGTGYKVRDYNDSTDTTTFVSKMVNGVPAVSNLDNLEGSLSYFSNLVTLDIKGNSNMTIFLSEYGLNTAFARITLTNKKITSLTMQYVSPDWNIFDLTNIKHLDELLNIDISNNLGIKSLNPLLNINRYNYSTVNFSNIGEVFEYNEFVIDNLASASCTVTYTNKVGTTVSTNSGNASLLVNLGDIDDFVSEHLYLTNVIYNDDGTTTDVCWRVEQGYIMNPNEINQGGDLETIDSVRAMNLRISPYYYCESDSTYNGYNFKQHILYKIVVNTNNEMEVTPINGDANGNLVYDIQPVNGVPSTDFENISDSDPNLSVYDPHLKFSGEYSRTQEATSDTGNIYDQDSRIVSDTIDYTLRFNYFSLKFGASAYGSITANTYYLRANGNEFTCSTSTRALDCYFVLLTQQQADFVVELRNNTFRNTTDVIMEKYGIRPSGTRIILGTALPTRTINDYYIYSISTQKFLTVYGFSNDPESKFNINRSTDGYTLYNQSNQKYLTISKISGNGQNTPWAVGVLYYSTIKNESLVDREGYYAHYKTYWSMDQNTTYDMQDTVIKCAEKTPILDITMGKDMTATAYFNCVYIGNGRNGIAYKMYDTGTFLLISNQSSLYGENAQFCFLTQEEKDRLEEWYKNPQEDITIGSMPQNLSYYYIYNPYTRRFISGGTTSPDRGEIYKTVSDFNLAQLYYVHKDGNHARYYVTAAKFANYPTSSTEYNSGFNAYGGISEGALYIALYDNDDNTTNVFQSTGSPFKISYSIKASSRTYIAYKVNYTVAKVTARILERDIAKEYQFDKFYYLKQDITIDGVTYKAGNVIRFVVDAYYGKQYEADIEYYELILTYYDDKDKTETGDHIHYINQFNTADYVYYYLLNNDTTNVYAYSDGHITYNKIQDSPDDVFINYNASATYTTHTNPTGITVTFPETKWIYTNDSFDKVKATLYLDDQGVTSAANIPYNENTTYYKEKYVVATVFKDTFETLKSQLYTDKNGTKVAANATYSPTATYYVVGYSPLTQSHLATNREESYTYTGTNNNGQTIVVEIPTFEYYKFGIYTNASGTRVPLYATYNPNATYYFLQSDGTYSTERPKVYSGLAGDYVTLTLDATTFEYFKHNLYSDKNGTLVSGDDQYNSDKIYYMDDYVASNFRQEVLDKYRDVLYKDRKGKALDAEESFNPSVTYYTNQFVTVTVTAGTFNNMKNRIYLDQYGAPLPANATYSTTATYYRKVFEVANPEPTGNTEDAWITTKNDITRLYSHANPTTQALLDQYRSDYTKIYTSGGYPTIYKFIGVEEYENIFANPTVEVAYEQIRTGTVTALNFDSLKSNLYDDEDGKPLAANATYEPGKIYYVKTWNTVANIVYADTTYRYNYGYYLIRDNTVSALNQLQWRTDEDGINSDTAQTMDDIIDEANSHFHDADYNLWYGKHYAYNGFTMQSTKEIFDEDGNILHGYDKGYVYRIVLNADNTGFAWQRIYHYYRKEGPTMVTEASTGVAQIGDTIWATSQCFGGFYTGNKFYRIVEDDFTKTLNVIQFTDVTLANHLEQGYTDILGQKIRYIYQGDYLGYAGTFEIIISAVVRENDGNGGYNYTDSVRTYKIKFVGTVIW